MSYEWKTTPQLQNTSPGHRVRAERIRQEAGTAKDKLDRHRETQREEHGHRLVGSQGTDDRQDRMASTCGPMHG